jgi:hypothetical protein
LELANERRGRHRWTSHRPRTVGQGQMHVGVRHGEFCFLASLFMRSSWLREPDTPETDASATRDSLLQTSYLGPRQKLRSSTRPLGISGSDLKLSRASKERREGKIKDSGEDATGSCSGARCGCAEVGHCSLAHDDASLSDMRFGWPVTPYAPRRSARSGKLGCGGSRLARLHDY